MVAKTFRIKKKGDYIREGYFANLVLVDFGIPLGQYLKKNLAKCGCVPFLKGILSVLKWLITIVFRAISPFFFIFFGFLRTI